MPTRHLAISEARAAAPCTFFWTFPVEDSGQQAGFFSQVLLCCNWCKDALYCSTCYSAQKLAITKLGKGHLANTRKNFPAHSKGCPPSTCSVCALGCEDLLGNPPKPSLWVRLKESWIWEARSGTEPWQLPSPPQWEVSVGKVLLACNTAVWHKQSVSS